MGWLFTLGASRKDVADAVTKTSEWTRDDGVVVRHETLARYYSGNDLWSVLEVTQDGKQSLRVILLFKLSRGNGDGWGYKDVSESMGPCAVSCPLKFLDMVPNIPNKYAAEWRPRVRAYWKRRKARAAERRELKAARKNRVLGWMR
jgi:hypothetical protein